MIACEPTADKLGIDIFPAGDTILIYTDTITNIQTTLERARPWVTSVNPDNPNVNRIFFLGSLNDSLSGQANAEIITEFGTLVAGDFGENPIIDSLKLYLFLGDVIGDTVGEMHVSIYEFLDSLHMDSLYYSDYDITGKYKTEPLVEKTIVPKPSTLYEFEIENEDFLNRIRKATKPDDSIFIYNSRLQRNFPGLYIKTERVTSGGAMAKVHLANSLAGLKFKYLHDSIVSKGIDSVRYSTFTMSFTPFYAQKVNIFEHDFTGTYLENLLDKPDAESPIMYIQGMGGANVRVRLPDIAEQLGFAADDKIAINAAKLVFYIVPDSISGISEDEYPVKLMMDTQYSDGDYYPLYDYLTTTNDYYFGRLTQSNKQSAFLDPVYFYNFHIGRHLQSVLSGEVENSDLLLYMDQPETNSRIIKCWSNYSGQNGGLRLELIYTKF